LWKSLLVDESLVGGGVCIWKESIAFSLNLGVEKDLCRLFEEANGSGDEDNCWNGSTGGNGRLRSL
jgi:hypothetical protein